MQMSVLEHKFSSDPEVSCLKQKHRTEGCMMQCIKGSVAVNMYSLVLVELWL